MHTHDVSFMAAHGGDCVCPVIHATLFPGNFLVCRSSPHHPALLDFGLTKELPREMQRALAKMLLATAEVRRAGLLHLKHVDDNPALEFCGPYPAPFLPPPLQTIAPVLAPFYHCKLQQFSPLLSSSL